MEDVKVWFWGSLALILILFITVAGGIGGCTGIKAWHRSQKRADANNAVQITKINIRRAQQQAKVTQAQNAIVKQQAQQRYLQSVGIREAQDEISKTLTPLYLQWEAVQAQMKLANSPSHTQIYVPSGTNGVPLVQTAPQP